MKLSRRLYDARKELCRERNLMRIIIAGRIPGYGKHADTMTAREYVESVSEKAPSDPVLTAQLSNGFALQGLIPDYLPSDHDSRGYATFLEWRNWITSGVPAVVTTIMSSRFDCASCNTRCDPFGALTSSPSSVTFSWMWPRITNVILCSSRNCLRRSRCHVSRPYAPGRRHANWRNSRRSISVFHGGGDQV